MIGEVALQMGVHGTGQMARGVVAFALRGIGQRRARIDDRKTRLPQRRDQFLGRNQGLPVHRFEHHPIAHRTASSRSRRFTSIAAVAPQMRCRAYWYSW